MRSRYGKVCPTIRSRLFLLLATFSVGLFTVTSAHAANYYIAPNGNNSNPGTSAAPWKTFAYAIPNLNPGDTLLLCTDGLVNMCKDAEIIPEFRKNWGPAEIVPKLIAMANDNGGKDNITVVVADISPSASTVFRRRLRAFSRKRGAGILWFLLWVIWSGLMIALGYFLATGFGDQ